ncbi:MAG TPA: GtrA family protein [Rugosimonospora sp.]|nr:GtrA family protein [Rugosimonospora sp.]
MSASTANSPSESSTAAPGLLRPLWARFGHLAHELGKFGVVGGVSYVVDVTVSNVLLKPVGPFWASTISMTVAATLAFVGNRFWTWRDRERSGLRREYLLYFGFNLVGLLIGLACVWLTWNLLGHYWPHLFRTRLAYNVAKNLVGMVLGTLFRFWSYRRFVFAPRSP